MLKVRRGGNRWCSQWVSSRNREGEGGKSRCQVGFLYVRSKVGAIVNQIRESHCIQGLIAESTMLVNSRGQS